MIEKCPEPQKDIKKRRKQVCFNENFNRECDNDEDNDDHKIYASMACMSSDDDSQKCKLW